MGIFILGGLFYLAKTIQKIKVEVSTRGYGGLVFWYQDKHNFVSIVVYPLTFGLYLSERYNGVETVYHYGFRTWHTWWYDLRVDANSITGQLDIYIDGSYIFTYYAETPKRTGQSGVTFGNGGASFDDLKITYRICDADYNRDGTITNKDLINKRKDLFEQAVQEALEEFNNWKDRCWSNVEENQNR